MGDALGWSWLQPPYVWTLGATTVRPTEAFQFDGRAVRALCDADPELGFQLTRRFLSVAADRLLATGADCSTTTFRHGRGRDGPADGPGCEIDDPLMAG